jgi:hypothetical protein
MRCPHSLGLSALLAAACLTSCATQPISPNQPTIEPWTNYAIGRVQDAATGSPMVEWMRHARFLRGYVMVSPVKVERIGGQPPTDAGVWPARYTYHGPCTGGRYVITNKRFYNEQIGIIVAEDGTIPCAPSVFQIAGLRAGRNWSTPGAVGVRAFAPTPFFADANAAPIKWELIYSGRSGSEIVLDHREYANGPEGAFARPAFNQQLKYDLPTSNHVVYRSLEIEIVEASNAGVKFRVLRDAEQSSTPQPATNLAPRAP